MRSRSVKLASAVLLFAACGSRTEPQPVTPSARAVPALLEAATLAKPDPIVKGAPHGSDVLHIAVTEQADAALTVDATNSMRLWPTLDGTRTPVPITFASEAAQIAITHAGRDLVAIIRDRGGAITVMRLGLDGTLRGRIQLGGDDAGFEEVVTAGDQLITRTADHAIEWYSVDGTLRGRRELDPGQRVTDLAARRGRIAAIVADKDASYLRWLTIRGDTLRMEPMMQLPLTPRAGMFAIAPERRRIAFVDTGNTGLHVLDVDLVPTPVTPEAQPFVNESHTSLGFVDDDTVAMSGHNVQWWEKAKPAAPPSTDPWAVPDMGTLSPAPQMGGMLPLAAYADGVVVSSHNGSLAIGNTKHVQYLGWRTSAAGGFMNTGNQVVLAQSGAKFLWLDDDLQKVRSIDMQKRRAADQSWIYGSPLGDHHMLAQTHYDDRSTLEVLDVDDAETRIPVIARAKVEQYFIGHSVLAVKVGRELRRFKLDLEGKTAVEQLPKIKLTDYSLSYVRAFDPELANGLVAIAVTWPGEYSSHLAITHYRVVNGKLTKQREKKFEGQILRASATGELVIFTNNGTSPVIRIVKDGVVVREILREGTMPPPIAIHPTALRFASRSADDVVVFDDTGAEVWRKPFWGASNMMFSRSGKRLIVAAMGGLVALDAETGEQVTRECGFEFGLHDAPSDFGPHGFASVCEDPLVQ